MGENRLNLLCLGLNVGLETALPTKWYEDIGEMSLLAAACKLRHEHFGRRLTTIAREVLLQGWFHVADDDDEGGFTVSATVDRAQPPAVLEFKDATACKVLTPWSALSHLEVEVSGRKVLVTTVAGELSDSGVQFPAEKSNDWKDFLFDADWEGRRIPEAPEADPKAKGGKKGKRESRGAQPPEDGLSDVLAERIKRLATPQSKGRPSTGSSATNPSPAPAGEGQAAIPLAAPAGGAPASSP